MIPFPSTLSYSFSYTLRYPTGVIVVDLGWNSDSSWDAFRVGLQRADIRLDEVIGVVVTHVHPDHYGLAERIKVNSSAWIGMHTAERRLVAANAADRTARMMRMVSWLESCGVPAAHLSLLKSEESAIAGTMASVEPDIELVDGVPVPETDGALVPLHTPGHTAGHLCFHDADRKLLFTGDHLLPRITPNVSKRPESDNDPLLDFSASLATIRNLSANPLILPGHEWAFDNHRGRVDILAAHHEARLDEVESAVRGGADTVWSVATSLTWSRPFADLDPRGLRASLGETHAHLARLASGAGRITEVGGEPLRWEVVD